MNRIALVEDNSRLAAMIVSALSDAGVQTDAFETIKPAWQALRDTPYGLLVVDRGLPDGDGLDLVRRVRAAGLSIPCLMLTARDALHDRIDGLESGADDYLTKPFPMQEMIARVRALMRRPPTIRPTSPSYVDLTILPDEGRMTCGQESITLAPAEVQIMICLVRAEGHTVRRGMLEAAAWGLAEAVTPNALDVALHRLRRKLQAIGSALEIANNRGHGYALHEIPLEK